MISDKLFFLNGESKFWKIIIKVIDTQIKKYYIYLYSKYSQKIL